MPLRGRGQAIEYTAILLLAILLPYVAGVRGPILVLVAMGASIPIAALVASEVYTFFGKLERVLPPEGERTGKGPVRMRSHSTTLGLSREIKTEAPKQQARDEPKTNKGG